MKRPIVTLLCCHALCTSAGAADQSTDVVVKIPPQLKTFKGSSVDQVRVTVNGRVQTAAPGQELQFNLHASEGDNVLVNFSLMNSGIFFTENELTRWHAGTMLKGSGHLVYTISGVGTGWFEEDPLVVLQVRGANVDVAIDNKVLRSLVMVGAPGAKPGEMELRKEVTANANHILEWRDHGGGKVCIQRDVNLPANVRRQYLCDAKKRTIEEN
jgi:hypothetical protein